MVMLNSLNSFPVFPCSSLSIFRTIILSDLIRQFLYLHFFGVSCWKSTVFFGWCHSSLIFCDLLALYPWMGEIPQRKEWQLTSVFLPGESRGQSNLEGYTVHRVTKSCPWLRNDHFHCTQPCIAVCTEEAAVTSSRLYELTSVWKDLCLQARVPRNVLWPWE